MEELEASQRMPDSLYTPKLAALICERMAKGESLRSICKADDMPAESTVRLWAIDDRDGFAAQYARAREAQMDALGEDILEIADDGSRDYKTVEEGGHEREVVDHDHIARSRLRVDSRKWLMSKIAPKRYGDKITHAGDAENPLSLVPVINVTVGRVGPSSSSETG